VTLKEKIKSGMNICGPLVNLPGTCIAEIMSYPEYDYIWIDLEHTSIDVNDCYNQLVAAKSVGRDAIVRVPQNDLTYTKKVLEMGPDGIIFPMVHNAKEAEELLSYTLYPPYGKRGCGPKRAVKYGLDDEIAFFKAKEDNLCRFLQVECTSFIEDMEKIATNPFIDGFILGLADLSGSINEIGNFLGENNLNWAKRAIDIALKNGKIVGTATLATDEKSLSVMHNMGIKMITCGADFDYLMKGAMKTLETVRNVMK